jgi:hypothetical protein
MKPSLDERENQLKELIRALRALVSCIKHDTSCQWIAHFDRCLANAESLHGAGFRQSDLNALSSQVRQVSAGSGSFSDYVPGTWDEKSGRIVAIPGMEDFEQASQDAYRWADELRIVGRY